MRILSFGPDGGRRISLFDSDFLQVLLTQSGDECSASAMFLGPGGVIGRHRATTPQMLCVVAGSGFVSGADGEEFRSRHGRQFGGTREKCTVPEPTAA